MMGKGIIDHSPEVIAMFRTGRNLLILGCALLAGVVMLAPSAWFVMLPAFVIVFAGQRLVYESHRIALRDDGRDQLAGIGDVPSASEETN